MVSELVNIRRLAASLQITLVRMEPKLDIANSPRNQHPLAWPLHPHCYIRFALQQVFNPVRRHQFNDQFRVRSVQRSDDRRQHFHANDVAGSNTDGAADSHALTRRRPQQRSTIRFQRFGKRLERQRFLRRAKTLLRADKKRVTHDLFERIHMAPYRRLRQSQRTRRPRERTLADYAKESPVQIPARFSLSHTKMYISSIGIDNFI